jgi:hypothetical protein
LKTLMWDVEILSYTHTHTYIYMTHPFAQNNNYILHRLCKKYSWWQSTATTTDFMWVASPLQIRSDPCRKNSDPRLNLLEILICCQQLVLISILLWFYKPIESIVDCIVVVIIVALELLSWI